MIVPLQAVWEDETWQEGAIGAGLGNKVSPPDEEDADDGDGDGDGDDGDDGAGEQEQQGQLSDQGRCQHQKRGMCQHRATKV